MIPLSDLVMRLLLVAVVVLPLLGSLAALLPAPPALRGSGPEQAVLRHGVTVTGAVLVATVLLALGFDQDHPAAVQAESDIDWIPALGIRLHFGIDGVSLPLLVLTALLTFLCALYSYFSPPRGQGASPAAFVSLLLVLESGTLATFAVLDLMLFFLAFEMVLIPMYFLIARWGGEGRAQAAWKFILYTLLGSVVMLLGLLLVGLRSGGSFDMVALASDNGPALPHTVQLVAVLAIGIGLAVKTPMWPLHSWLPDAHTAAPTVSSVLLAGVLLKMGTYGFVRIVLPVAPDGMRTFAPYLAALAVVGIIYGSLACLSLARQGARGDLKRLIAYSSVGHMGFVLLGIATMTHTGVNGALFANVAHGLITGLLFFLVGALKDRTGTTDLDALSGRSGAALYGLAPRFGGLLAFGAVASLGLPGLAGFWGEMLALLGAYHPADGLSRPAFLTFTALGALGTLLTAAYMLVVVRRICMGDPADQQERTGHTEHTERTELTGEPGRPAQKAPAEAAAPGESEQPGAAAEPAEPTEAAGEPGEPEEAEAPEDSEKPQPAAVPERPHEPEQPEQPGEPGESEKAAEAAEPGEPAPERPAPTPAPVSAAALPPAVPTATVTTSITTAAATTPTAATLPDVRPYEFAAWTPLVVLTVLAGLWPALLLGLTDPAVQHLLPGVSR